MPRKLHIPDDEEEAAINRGIALDPDSPETTAEQFANARYGNPFSNDTKVPLSIRLDSDIVAHFKAGGKGWQTRINAALRQAVADGKA